MPIEITPTLSIDDSELRIDFIRASGPGGQNVNKVASAVQLRFDAANSSSLTDEIRQRLLKLAGSRATEEGVIVIEAKRYRTQEQNRADAILRFSELVRKATIRPKVRRATKPTVSAKAARVTAKKRRGAVKRIRKYNPEEWE